MKKRSIALIIWLMSIALIAVMAMQYYFVRESFRQKSKLFDEAVNASLATVVSRIERKEIYDFAREQERQNQERYRITQQNQEKKEKQLAQQLRIQDEIKKSQIEIFNYQQKFQHLEKQMNDEFVNTIPITNEFFETYVRRKEYRHLITIRLEKFISPEMKVQEYARIDALKQIPSLPVIDDSVRFIIPEFEPFYNTASSFQWVTLPPRTNYPLAMKIIGLEKQLADLSNQSLHSKSGMITLFDSVAVLGGKKSSVVADVAMGIELAKRPLEKRLNRNYVKQLLVDELAKRGVKSSFVMSVKNDNNFPLVFQEIYVVDNENLKEVKNLTPYTAKLFQGDEGKSPGELSIFFPNKESIIAGTMGYWLFPTILALLALLIGCFAYTLSIIFRQKKISEMKTDFINNMTHEFKTPVATIMIASESLKDPEISSDDKRVNKLANIIYDENVRLGNHIERVLNIARLEKENLKIERVNVQINELTNAVIESMKLQLEKAKGTIDIDLSAKNDVVIGDELHLSNVLFNLVDNAIKYSKDEPHITVKTMNKNGNIIISVADRGIGMTKDQQEKIFDQFYRIPTGNIHNVKGFGLGLSYVNDIIKRLNGKISVRSEKDKGTQFEVTLPLKHTSEQVA
ncbi:ATP-binding protein [Sphingobacterium sp. HJSM2_6]|uniref:sensor histidine kinase n=1 Tax=Sphingobacterium sp. HJSM2_6 TaxID=3366264 RepID=UPI003BE78C65